MELFVSAKLAHSKFHGIPWNCSCQQNWRILSSMAFHGIPWNFSFQRNLRTPIPRNSMEFHGTYRVSEIDALQVPWNSMELLVSAKLAHSKFHGIPWNSMELLESSKLAHPKFHGILWNCLCQRNWFTPSSMEFHGTVRVIDIGLLQFPWNSMELLLSTKLAHSKFHGIPWNCSFHRNWCTRSSMEFHGTAGVMEPFLLFNGTIGIINALSFKMV